MRKDKRNKSREGLTKTYQENVQKIDSQIVTKLNELHKLMKEGSLVELAAALRQSFGINDEDAQD